MKSLNSGWPGGPSVMLASTPSRVPIDFYRMWIPLRRGMQESLDLLLNACAASGAVKW